MVITVRTEQSHRVNSSVFEVSGFGTLVSVSPWQVSASDGLERSVENVCVLSEIERRENHGIQGSYRALNCLQIKFLHVTEYICKIHLQYCYPILAAGLMSSFFHSTRFFGNLPTLLDLSRFFLLLEHIPGIETLHIITTCKPFGVWLSLFVQYT